MFEALFAIFYLGSWLLVLVEARSSSRRRTSVTCISRECRSFGNVNNRPGIINFTIMSEKNTIYVGGLADDVTEKLLHDIFIVFGDISEIQVLCRQTFARVHAHAGMFFRCQSITKARNTEASPSWCTRPARMLSRPSTT